MNNIINNKHNMYITRNENICSPSPIKVAAYVRVSTIGEEQAESYANQKQYYEAFIRANPIWTLTNIYADYGISGTGATHRTEFQQMINDAIAGKINLIFVKSISRFARNAIDTQKYIHLLKEHNVEVRFEKESLSSFDSSTEMILNMMSMIAEYEAHSISKNVRWALDKQLANGIRHIGNNRVLGYDETDGKLIPNDDAKTIKIIYESYSSGASLSSISKKLHLLGIKTLRGNDYFSTNALKYILSNEIYVGDRLMQKKPPKDFYTKKPDASKEYKSVFIKNHHEGIISRELWEKVQKRLKGE